MTTVNTVLTEKLLRVGKNSGGYYRKKIFYPNLPVNGGDSVTSVNVTANGSNYISIPTISFTGGGGGSGAAASARMGADTISIVSPQSGAGSYAPNDILSLAGGGGTNPQIQVNTTKLVSATIVNGGTGGTDGNTNVILVGGIGVGAQLNVTVTGGTVTAINSIVVPGQYTQNPPDLNNAVANGGPTGLVLSVKMGINTASIYNAGFLNSLAANPVGQSTTTGSGTGATFNLTYKVTDAFVTNGGNNYQVAPTVVFTGGGGSGAAATAVLGGSGDAVTTHVAFNKALETNDYAVKVISNQACLVSVDNKAIDGFDFTLTPLQNGALTDSLNDLVIEYTA